MEAFARPTIKPKDPRLPHCGDIRGTGRDALWMKHVIGIDTTSPI